MSASGAYARITKQKSHPNCDPAGRNFVSDSNSLHLMARIMLPESFGEVCAASHAQAFSRFLIYYIHTGFSLRLRDGYIGCNPFFARCIGDLWASFKASRSPRIAVKASGKGGPRRGSEMPASAMAVFISSSEIWNGRIKESSAFSSCRWMLAAREGLSGQKIWLVSRASVLRVSADSAWVGTTPVLDCRSK